MNPTPHTDNRPADVLQRQAVDRAKDLLASAPSTGSTPSWAHETSHVGDLSVLVLALLD